MQRVAGILFSVAVLMACQEPSTTPIADPAAAVPVMLGFKGTLQRSDGIRSATIVSDSAYPIENAGRLDLYGVQLQFFNQNGMLTGTLTSETAEYDVSGKMFIARGNVVLISPAQNGERRLETSEMFYDIGGDRLWSDHPFTLSDGGRTSRGQRFQSNSNGTIWDVIGGSGDIPVGAGGGLSF